MISLANGLALLLAVTFAISLWVVRRLHTSSNGPRDVLEDRFILGIPWGTVVSVAVVLSIYLFVQDGITDFSNPVVKPFRAWSYFYLLGMFTASFSHATAGHLIGNLIGTIVVAPIAEYAWSHYPRRDDGSRTDSRSWWTTPWIRAFVIFPGAVIGVGLLTALFSLGPVIGFSGVVFAFAGFAIVRYPITTIIAVLGIRSAVVLVYNALQSPILEYVAEPRPPSPPGWATTAIQGHAFGFLIGVVLAIVLLERRDSMRPNAFRIWLALLLFGFSESLWAIYWFGGQDTFILFRGPGVVIVAILALVVTLAVAREGRSLIPDWIGKKIRKGAYSRENESLRRAVELAFERSAPQNSNDRIRDLVAGTKSRRPKLPFTEVPRRQYAFVVVLLVLAAISGPAVATNLFVIDSSGAGSEAAIEIEDYTVEYVEGAENELVSFVNVSAFGVDTAIESSGVVVSSSERQVWIEAVPKQRLAFSGEETVHVGGPGWRESVHVERSGWTPVGNQTVYAVWLTPERSATGYEQTGETDVNDRNDTDDRILAFESDSAQADVVIENATVSVFVDRGEFYVAFETGDEPGAIGPIPDEDESIEVDEMTVEHEDGTIYVVASGTRVPVAEKETYE